jgi:hypothetical protein
MLSMSESRDGKWRASLRVSFRIELGAAILAAVEEMEGGATSLRRKRIEERIRNRLADEGYSWLHYGGERTRHGEEDKYDEYADKLAPRVEALFPELIFDWKGAVERKAKREAA